MTNNYRLSAYEQEVVINFNAKDENATLYTSNPAWIRKMDKLAEKRPDVFKLIEQTEVSKTYEFSKKRVHLSTPRIMTEEERQAARDRLSKVRKDEVDEWEGYEDEGW